MNHIAHPAQALRKAARNHWLAPRRWIWAATAAMALLGAPAQALILAASPNAVFLSTRAEVSFEGVSRVALTRNDVAIADTPGMSVSSTADRLLLPFSGDAKDVAQGSVSLHFLGGSGLESDSFSIDFSGRASAVAAEVAAGDPAGARVVLRGTLLFQLDEAFTGLPANTLYGQLHLDAARAALPYESFSVQARDRSLGLLGTLLPGGDALDVTLRIGHAYEILFSYEMYVPYGVDPDIALRLQGWAGVKAPVPEPPALVLGALGAVLLGLRRRRDA